MGSGRPKRAASQARVIAVSGGPQARAQLEVLGIPLFGVDIRRLEAFEAAADEGVIVGDLPDRRARRGWEDYRRMGEELVEWVMALRTPDLRTAGSGGGA